MFATGGWRIGRVRGIEIRIDPSWLFIFFLVGYTFFLTLDEEFGSAEPGQSLFWAAVMTLAFFGSVLVHELAHALVATAKGIEVKGITLFLFGGATHAKLDSENPRDEFQIAGVGPLTSLAIAALMWGIVNLLGGVLSDYAEFAIGRLGWLNLALGVFNLVPGFPLDGGRLLRSVVWQRTGSLERATRTASRAGRTFGYILVSLGVLEVLLGGFIGGLWFVAIGWFLAQAAEAGYAQLIVRRVLLDVEAGDLMSDQLVHIGADATLQEAVDDYFMRHDYSAFPVDDEGRTVGLLTLGAVRNIPREEWASRTAGQAMEGLETATTAGLHESMDKVLDRLEGAESSRVLIVDDGHVVGLITSRDIAAWLRRAQELGLAEPLRRGPMT